jgi:hypothetical protein
MQRDEACGFIKFYNVHDGSKNFSCKFIKTLD